ncbi:MAG: LytR C-terminal domain-containing protein [Actinomycetaceae bacterium]|nr:LytR C-terminal domain-containing protein [Arcanobacterium sp.]MDD7504594.1 LytR C-terminal domain-containing protein [Actinomycetaceae bacterium]MDY6143237.1 LytR C-terminal domain-containing protein [Arcanobacterium sp.]
MAQAPNQHSSSQLSATDARTAYQHKLHQRQTVVFGSIGAVLAALLVICTFLWISGIPFPFNKEYSQDPRSLTIAPCPPGDTALDPATITARVYNGGLIEGLAGQVGEKLNGAGVEVADTTNWGGDDVIEAVRIYTGKDGVQAAYTLRAYFPDASVIYDSSNTSKVVDVVLGAGWDSMVEAPSEENFADAMKPIDKCMNLSDL